MIFISQLFAGGVFIAEEILIDRYDTSPLDVTAYEGAWGFIIMVTLLPILQYTKCNDPDMCPDGVLEDTMVTLGQMASVQSLLPLSIALMASMAIENVAGVSISKFASCSQR